MESENSYILQLSTELLIKIFSYLNVPDLSRLRQTCKRFNVVITCWDHVLIKNIFPVVTNQANATFLSRCHEQLSTFEKIRISRNWEVGRYREKSLLYVRRRYIPWLHLTRNSIWISRGNHIYCYGRTRKHVNISRPISTLRGRSNADVGHFQLKNNSVISGQRDGSIWLKDLRSGKVIFDQEECHESDINSIDISENGKIIVSGSRDSSFKVWNVDRDSYTDILKKTYTQVFYDRVLRVSLSKEQPLLAVGTSGNDYIKTLFIYNLESLTNPTEFSTSHYGSGILDLKWDGPQTIWSCGYDTYLRLWDLRTGKPEQNFVDPHAAVLYCLDYDYYNTVMVGSQYHGRVILWDIRHPHPVQLYFTNSCRGDSNKSSPTYSLSFDSECLFTATDRNLNVYNFSVYDGEMQDYSCYLK
ncbi:hypothetical protein NQ315_008390 [Exocentrus adspersus]|uniref:F-box domain-containing protein n=1 Tax=Exocentrus adspersus TaxID=1586481 RepID=A0AAV8W5Z6_9CUCU|nr:hypothetical protein NQ315_008390 [Exocentrus adspersus]